MREQAATGERANARLVRELLPVLDDFERALGHGEVDDGIRLVFRQLRGALDKEGLEEIPADGQAFDPTVHEAVAAVEDPAVGEPQVRDVFRKGYRFKDQVLRPAMVVVARPPDIGDAGAPDDNAAASEQRDGDAAAGG